MKLEFSNFFEEFIIRSWGSNVYFIFHLKINVNYFAFVAYGMYTTPHLLWDRFVTFVKKGSFVIMFAFPSFVNMPFV